MVPMQFSVSGGDPSPDFRQLTTLRRFWPPYPFVVGTLVTPSKRYQQGWQQLIYWAIPRVKLQIRCGH